MKVYHLFSTNPSEADKTRRERKLFIRALREHLRRQKTLPEVSEKVLHVVCLSYLNVISCLVKFSLVDWCRIDTPVPANHGITVRRVANEISMRYIQHRMTQLGSPEHGAFARTPS
jgi:hypothetical protein